MLEEFIPSMIWLLFVSFSLGFALTREKNLMAMGFGLALFSVLSIVFNLVGIPLNWLVFLAISIAIFAYFIYKKELVLKIEKPDLALALVLLFALVNVYVFWIGATSYPYLEDDDPWVHAVGAEWITQTGSYSRYFDGTNFFRLYIEPYPPAYDILMGVLHQMTSSVSNTLKFYNALLCGLSLVFAFYAITELTKDRRIGLFSAFFLLVLPSFMGHFIWAQTLAMLLLFVSFYGLEKSFSDKRFIVPAGIAIGAITLTQPSVSAVFFLLFLAYAIARLDRFGKDVLKTLAIIGLIALVVAAAYYIPTLLKYGPEYTSIGIGFFETLFSPGATGDTSAGQAYSLEDFIFAKPEGKIDQQIGIGLVISALAILGFALALLEMHAGNKGIWMPCAAIWFVLCIFGTQGDAMPLKLFPHRFWVFLSIPVAILAAYAYTRIEQRLREYSLLILAIVVLSVLATSAYPKYLHQTSLWTPGTAFYSTNEVNGYMYMKTNLPKNTLVFPLCSPDLKVIGSDMLSEPYVKDYEIFKRSAMNKTPGEVYSFLSSRNYSYIVLDSTCITEMGEAKANELLSSYGKSGDFEEVPFNGAFYIFRIK